MSVADTLTFRVAYSDETGRAASLCTPSPEKPGEGPTRCFVAVKSHPVERLVGAAFWREIPGEQEQASLAEFEWAMVAALAGTEVESRFLEAVKRHVSKSLPAASHLQTSAMFPRKKGPDAILSQAGLAQRKEHIHFTARVSDWLEVMKASGASDDADEEQTAIAAPEPGQFDLLKPLLCTGGSRLRPSELAYGFQTAWGASPSLFDPRCSFVWQEEGQPRAACLANVHQTRLYLDALAAVSDAEADCLLRRVFRGAASFAEVYDLSFSLSDDDLAGGSAMARLIERFSIREAARSSRFQTALEGCR